jgi:hypothetical protein
MIDHPWLTGLPNCPVRAGRGGGGSVAVWQWVALRRRVNTLVRALKVENNEVIREGWGASMRITRTMAAALAGAALGLGPATMGISQAAASTPASRHTVAIQATGIPGNGRASYKPRMLKIAEGGPDLWAQHVRWSHWGAKTATGAGKLIGADSARMYFGTVTLKLSDVRQNSGTRYFEKIRIVGGKPGFAHHWHWLWSAGSYVG